MPRDGISNHNELPMHIWERITSLRNALGVLTLRGSASRHSEAYHADFVASGTRKADGVIAELRKYAPPLERMAYVSIGGSTGAEVIRALDVLPISHGILLEYDNQAAAVARDQSEFLKQCGKQLSIICGDATQKLPELRATLEEWRRIKKLNGVVISAQAVLHELPNRSPHFDLNHFLGELFWDWPNCFFVSREPTAPANWPKYVTLSINGFDSEFLEQVAVLVSKFLSFGGKIKRYGPTAIHLPSNLAVEVLTKVFYSEDFPHEIQEQVTSTTSDELANAIRRYLGPNSVSQSEQVSDSFAKLYRTFGVEARNRSNQVLDVPLCFIHTVAFRQIRGNDNEIQKGGAWMNTPTAIASEARALHCRAQQNEDIQQLLAHPDFPVMMSCSGRLERNPIWKDCSAEDLAKLKMDYGASGSIPIKVLHLDMLLMKRIDEKRHGLMYTYNSPDWGRLITFRQWHAQDDPSHRIRLAAENLTTDWGVASSTITPHFSVEYAISLKLNAKNDHLTLYIFDFVAVEFLEWSAQVETQMLDQERWRSLTELRTDPLSRKVNIDLTHALHEAFGYDLARLPASFESDVFCKTRHDHPKP